MKRKSIKVCAIILSLAAIFLEIGSFAQTEAVKEEIPRSKLIDSEKLLEDIRYLSSDKMEGRETGTPASTAARIYLLKRFKESGIKAFNESYEQKFSLEDRQKNKIEGANLIGFIKGKKQPEKYVVVSAHYDHLGVREGKVYNGADDNASGTAALFAIATYFKKHKPKHSIIFAAFDAEEKGLRGARHFVEDLPVKPESILLDVNMDMVSRNEKGELYAAGTYHYPSLKPYLEAVQKKASVKLLFGHDRPELKHDDWTFQSDHGVFHRKKIPFIYFGVEDHKDYHKPTDDFENIQPEFYVKAVETIVMALKEIDKNYVSKS